MEAINLYSDTQTRPTAAMRRAIAEAEVGDEQRGRDPTVNALQARVADLLGHEAALFLPSGTMCNQIAIRLHVERHGDEILLDRFAHPIVAEAGGAAVHAGATIGAIDCDGGIFDAGQLEAALRPAGRYAPRSRLVSVEQTTNYGGGRVWPLETVREVTGLARERGLRTHLDGARLLNATIASGVPARELAGPQHFDSAWIDFTKGLGAPVGACLAGSRELIDEAWRLKQMMGGAMRQAGIVAAAALHALDNHVDRLADDHAHARLLADALAALPGAALDPTRVETNIVICSVDDAAAVVRRMGELGVDVGALDARRVRAVTHLDVSRADVERAIEAFRTVLG